MSDIVTKYMASVPRQESAVVPIYSARIPSHPEQDPKPEPSEPVTATEMAYKVIRKLLGELPLSDRLECMRRLAKDVYEKAAREDIRP
jgi:hypothetical protein